MIALRFHPRCWHRDEGKIRSFPRLALNATVTDGAGGLQGVHRISLAPYGKGKARVETQRRAMGHLLGNAVRLTRYEDILVGDEGLRPCCRSSQLCPALPFGWLSRQVTSGPSCCRRGAEALRLNLAGQIGPEDRQRLFG